MTRLYILKINNYDPLQNSVQITFTRYAVVEKNVIMWKNIIPDDENYKQMIKDDFGNMMQQSITKN